MYLTSSTWVKSLKNFHTKMQDFKSVDFKPNKK